MGWWTVTVVALVGVLLLGLLVAGALRHTARTRREIDSWQADLRTATASLQAGAALIRARRPTGS